ncbi:MULTISPECIES: (Na+)-NQR maturation NqrM [Aliagarivorans]|uniref:(Na+)-NQR maturation NqrM n=1 Tax=Aliagarivorans TaxID=882379 RepID=UPI000411D70C|nr:MULTISPECIES: (Na+)-NQR maturation NqrM [Aliagarivorans]
MAYFIATFVFFLVIIAAMAIGYIVQQKTISGSCGGLASVGIDKECDCPEPCDRRKAKMAKEAAKEKTRQAMQKENRII